MNLCAIAALAAASALAASAASATVLYSTDFESPTFSLGALDGQGGWAVASLGGNADQVVVENTVTYSGGQAVEIPASAHSVAPYYAFGPITPIDRVVVSMAINVDATGGAVPETFAVATSPGYDDITAAVLLNPASGYVQARSGTYAYNAYPLIGTFTPGTWIDVSMTLDYATQTYSVSIDGAQLASDLPFCGDAPNSFTCDGNHISQFGDVELILPGAKNTTGATFIDDVSISEVPEPDAWALFIAGAALAGATLRARRRAHVDHRRGRVQPDGETIEVAPMRAPEPVFRRISDKFVARLVKT